MICEGAQHRLHALVLQPVAAHVQHLQLGTRRQHARQQRARRGADVVVMQHQRAQLGTRTALQRRQQLRGDGRAHGVVRQVQLQQAREGTPAHGRHELLRRLLADAFRYV